MTIGERAAKLAEVIMHECPEDVHVSWLSERIAAEIEAAVEEEGDKVSNDLVEHYHELILQRKAEAYEEAAKMVEIVRQSHFDMRPHEKMIDWPFQLAELAKLLRARAAEVVNYSSATRQCDQHHCGHESCNEARDKMLPFGFDTEARK